MLLRNQRGSLDYVLYGMAIISIIVFMFFLILSLTSSNEAVKTTSNIEREETTQRDNFVTIPNNWHTYTNEENDYTFYYPQEWGVVEQTESEGERRDAVSYEYRFTSNEKTVVSQIHALADEATHDDTYLMYNSFSTDMQTVTFCTTSDCEKSKSLSTSDVRLFSNQYTNESAEVVILDGNDLRMVQLIKTTDGNWPGVTISTLLGEDVDTSLVFDEILDDVITNNYVMAEQVRLFADYIP